jgi:hypothetical protein
MMDYLARHGFSNLDELDKKVQEVANGEALRNWDDLKSRLVEPFRETIARAERLISSVR